MVQTRQSMRRSERIRTKKAESEKVKKIPPPKKVQRPTRKRKRSSKKQRAVPKREESIVEPTPSQLQAGNGNSVYHWIQHETWPQELFIPPAIDQQQMPRNLCLAKPQREPGTLSHYSDTPVVRFLAHRQSFLHQHPDHICDEDQRLCERLLARNCPTPVNSLLEAPTLFYMRQRIAKRNETGVLILLHQLIVPPAEIEILRGNVVNVRHLVDAFNERWECSLPLPLGEKELGLPTPQPDHAVGFSSAAFTSAQLKKMGPLLGDWDGASPFKGTQEMFFPFLVAEAKSKKGSLDEAELQNAHCITRYFKGLVWLFRLAGKQRDLHRRIVGFSITYNHHSVYIHAHYVVFTEGEEEPACYRSFVLNAGLMSSDKWAPYKFVLAVYNDWVPGFLELLRSTIDKIPDQIDCEDAEDSIPA